MAEKIRRQLAQFKSNWDPRRRSEIFRKSLRNASYSSAEHIVLQLAMLISIPFFVTKLGVEQYGIWILASSTMGFMQFMSFGLGAATVKYISAYLTNKNSKAIVEVIRATLTMYMILGLFTAILVYLLAPLLVNRLFNVKTPNSGIAILSIRLAGFGVLARFIDSVFLGILQGYQRYDIASKTTIAVSGIALALNLALVSLGLGVTQMLLATVSVTLLGAIVKAMLVKRFLLPTVVLWPALNKRALKNIFGFGFYSWLQTIGGILCHRIDTFAVASLLGTSALTYYSVCLQLSQQIHAILAKALSFLFPLSSAAKEEGNLLVMRKAYFKSMNAAIAIGIAFNLTIFLFSGSVMSIWMGSDFASKSTGLLRILAFNSALGVTSIVPYYYMNGTGYVRLNAFFSLATGLIISISAVCIIPLLGIMGAALARVISKSMGIFARTIVHYKVLRDRRWYAGLLIFVPIFIMFAIGRTLSWSIPNVPSNYFWTFILIAVTGLVTLVLASLLCYIFNKPRFAEI